MWTWPSAAYAERQNCLWQHCRWTRKCGAIEATLTFNPFYRTAGEETSVYVLVAQIDWLKFNSTFDKIRLQRAFKKYDAVKKIKLVSESKLLRVASTQN